MEKAANSINKIGDRYYLMIALSGIGIWAFRETWLMTASYGLLAVGACGLATAKLGARSWFSGAFWVAVGIAATVSMVLSTTA